MPRESDANPEGSAVGDSSAFKLAWPLPIRVDLATVAPDEKVEAAEHALRARPGVAVFVGRAADESTDNRHTIAVSACGDLRAFVSGRLRGEGPRPDLSEVTTRIEACECGSGFEADLACDAVARARTPEAAMGMAAQHAVVFILLDPKLNAPACRVIDDPASLDGLDPASVIGPFAARAHAEAWSAMLDTRFSLCRKPATLALRPNAEACSYKDMGLCPAPCDGSEPMGDYLGRVREALAFDGARLASERDRVTASIAEAASEMDFERAGRLRAAIELLDGVRRPGLEWITTMDRLGALAVMPSVRTGWARLIAHRCGETIVLGDIRAGGRGDPGDAVKAALVMLDAVGERATSARFSELAGERVGLIAQHMRSARRTNGRFVRVDWGAWADASGPLDRGIDLADLSSAIRRAGRVSRATRAPAGEPGKNADTTNDAP